MKCLSKNVGCVVVALISLAALPACKKRGEAVKSDLSEAGYKMTVDDWLRASRENDVVAMKKFLSAKFPADSRNEEGDSALHVAAAAGSQAAADFLLDQKLHVDLRGGNERTPLMSAVLTDQKDMVRWLLRQGADPHLKDKEGYQPLMLAVRESRPNSVSELAAHDRENLDAALLLAALVGRTDVIDSLTNYGASVYAKMEDGRTPLMIAAENGHLDSVKLLLEIGASRYATDPEGRTAADIAAEAGRTEIAAIINREPTATDLALDSQEEIADSMEQAVDHAVAKSNKSSGNVSASPKVAASASIDGAVLSKAVADQSPVKNSTAVAFPMPPLVMRHYREKEVPIRIKTVQGDAATLRFVGTKSREIKVRKGDKIPGSNLIVVSVQRRMEDSKVSAGELSEISVVEVRDTSTDKTRKWISSIPSSGHDPVALVEDAASGKRYIASPGQRFKGADGAEYLISDIRPNQMVIQDTASGAVQTIPLRGPRG
jgi:ankyrin repeat protein